MNRDTGREVASGRYRKSPGFGVAGGLIPNIDVRITRAKYPSRKLSRSLELGAARSSVGHLMFDGLVCDLGIFTHQGVRVGRKRLGRRTLSPYEKLDGKFVYL